MTPDWLLIETLGGEPTVIAQGRQMKNFIPLAGFLRRNPNLAAIQAAVADTIAGGDALARDAEHNNRVIRTQPVQMSDGSMHAVHLWVGPADAEPPERPMPGPAKWDLTAQIPFVSIESLVNTGMTSATEPADLSMFAEVFPSLEYNRDEVGVLAMAVEPELGRTYCTTWEFTDAGGKFRRMGVAGRIVAETMEDGSEHLIGRGLNLVVDVSDIRPTPIEFGKRIIDALSQPDTYRCIVDLGSWALLKWLGEPCPLFDWRRSFPIHPEDLEVSAELVSELKDGLASAIVRLPGHNTEWVPVHVTLRRIELELGIYAGLATLRRPTHDELADVGLLGA